MQCIKASYARAMVSMSGIAAQAVMMLPATLVAQQKKTVRAAGFDVELAGDLQGFALQSDVTTIEEHLDILTLTLRTAEPRTPPRFTVRWAIPSHDVAGHWMTGRFVNKTIRPDWAGGRLQASMFAREGPVSCLFSSDNRNVLTFAVSDALNAIN